MEEGLGGRRERRVEAKPPVFRGKTEVTEDGQGKCSQSREGERQVRPEQAPGIAAPKGKASRPDPARPD